MDLSVCTSTLYEISVIFFKQNSKYASISMLGKNDNGLKRNMVNHLYHVSGGEAICWANHFRVCDELLNKLRPELVAKINSKSNEPRMQQIDPQKDFYTLPPACHIIFVANSENMQRMNKVLNGAKIIAFDTESVLATDRIALLQLATSKTTSI